MKKKLLLFLVLASLSACKNNPESSVDSSAEEQVANKVSVSPQQYRAAGIVIGQMQRKRVAREVSVTGVVEVPPQSDVVVAPPMAGFVQKIHVREGMRVRKGELLATLTHMDFIQLQQDYLERKSKLTFLKQEYERQEALMKENISAAKSYQQAKAEYESTQAVVQGMRTRLAILNIDAEAIEKGGLRSAVNIYAPISGYVGEVTVTTGQLCDAAQPLMRVINLEHVHLVVYVYEHDLPGIAEKQSVQFRLNNQEEWRDAKIFLVGKEVSDDRTVRVHCDPVSSEGLLPGMFISARIIVRSADSLVLPDSSIVQYHDNHYIFRPAGTGKFEMINIAVGHSANHYTEVSLPKNVNPGDSLVTAGAKKLLGLLKNNPE